MFQKNDTIKLNHVKMLKSLSKMIQKSIHESDFGNNVQYLVITLKEIIKGKDEIEEAEK